MWKYITNAPRCLAIHIGMVVTNRNTGNKETIIDVVEGDEWMGCRYPVARIIYTDGNHSYGMGPLYYREFDCMECRYVVREHIRDIASIPLLDI